MQDRWSRTPKYIMRMKCVEVMISSWLPCSFIEIGAGSGNPTSFFLERGYKGCCYDLGKTTRETLRKNLARFGDDIEVIDDLDSIEPSSFDCLISFETLEHIDNDFDMLKYWTSFLKPKGKILLSVPAHMKKYNIEDKMTGHIRRYDKNQLTTLLYRAGYGDIVIYNYGFPLCYITRNIANILLSDKNNDSMTSEEKSIASGIERPSITNVVSRFYCRLFITPFILAQKYFFNKDLGDGYVVSAVKK